MGYHTVVVDPFNSEGYNILAARKLKVYCPLARKLKGSPALAPKIAESLLFFKLASGRHTTQKITCRGS